MKTIIISTLFLLFALQTKSQSFVTLYYNPELTAQLTANQATRVLSEKMFANSYESQYNSYEKIQENMVKVVALKEMIYRQLTNVNAALLQTKQLQYMARDMQTIYSHLGLMMEMAQKHTKYLPFVTKQYENILTQATGTYSFIADLALKEDTDFLMDQADRQHVLNKVSVSINLIKGNLLSIIYYLKEADKRHYLLHINPFRNIYIRDKQIIEAIIHNANSLGI